MPPAVAIAGATLVGAGATLVAGSKAAKAQGRAADLSVAEDRRQYDQDRIDLAPWRTAGGAAVQQLARLYGVGGVPPTSTGDPANDNAAYGGFFASPGYRFRLDEGIKAVERSAAARGLLRSGAAAKSIQRYGEGLAASEYDSYAARLAQLAGLGQGAAAGTVAAGQTATSNITQALMASGNARASSYANTGSAVNTGLNNLMTAYLFQQGGGFGKAGGI